MSTMTKQITLVEKKWLGKSLFSLLCYGESQPRSRLFWGISRQEKAHFQKQIKFFFSTFTVFNFSRIMSQIIRLRVEVEKYS